MKSALALKKRKQKKKKDKGDSSEDSEIEYGQMTEEQKRQFDVSVFIKSLDHNK